MTIFPRKVRHISPSRDFCLRLTAKYLHIDIPDQESWNCLCVVTLRALFL